MLGTNNIQEYSIAGGYKLLQGPAEKEKFSKQIWCRMSMPKHSFILWLAVKNRLLTRSRLQKFRMLANANCVLCDADEETREHLFFKCPKTATCLLQLRELLGWKSNAGDLIGVLRWIQRAKVSRFKK